MASNAAHLPASIVEPLDRLAAARGTSRNRVLLEASEELLGQHRLGRPPDFFERAIDAADLAELRAGGEQLEDVIRMARRTRPVPPR